MTGTIIKETIVVMFNSPEEYEGALPGYVNRGYTLLKRKTEFKPTGVFATFVQHRRLR
jgi:hypothetical protein